MLFLNILFQKIRPIHEKILNNFTIIVNTFIKNNLDEFKIIFNQIKISSSSLDIHIKLENIRFKRKEVLFKIQQLIKFASNRNLPLPKFIEFENEVNRIENEIRQYMSNMKEFMPIFQIFSNASAQSIQKGELFELNPTWTFNEIRNHLEHHLRKEGSIEGDNNFCIFFENGQVMSESSSMRIQDLPKKNKWEISVAFVLLSPSVPNDITINSIDQIINVSTPEMENILSPFKGREIKSMEAISILIFLILSLPDVKHHIISGLQQTIPFQPLITILSNINENQHITATQLSQISSSLWPLLTALGSTSEIYTEMSRALSIVYNASNFKTPLETSQRMIDASVEKANPSEDIAEPFQPKSAMAMLKEKSNHPHAILINQDPYLIYPPDAENNIILINPKTGSQEKDSASQTIAKIEQKDNHAVILNEEVEELVYILIDNSGSMSGDNLRIAKEIFALFAENSFKNHDLRCFGLYIFDSEYHKLHDLLPCTLR